MPTDREHTEAVQRASELGATNERARIAAWLHRKADETEELLKLAAERGEPEGKQVQLWFAKKTRVLLYVLASMVEKNALAPAPPKGEEP